MLENVNGVWATLPKGYLKLPSVFRLRINRLGSIDSVDKRLRKVEYNQPRMDGQVELLTKMHLAGTTSHPQAQEPSDPREKDRDMA
uniref:Uncharacterized protein n=1 Tax=Hyaloperonospora arabidopsidis (strain Emoy2) TaxID=559515 RepID=M4BJK4_HYAAE